MCKVCSERHSIVLHGLKIQKYKTKGNNEDTDTKENKPEQVKFASTDTGSRHKYEDCSCTNQIKGYQQNSSHLCTPG